MSTSSEERRFGEGQADTGPPPYYHHFDCNICRKQDGLKTGSQLLDYPPPGGYIVERQHFLVEHAPQQESSAGTVIVESRRHLLDFAEMNTDELAELGQILHRLQGVAYMAQQPPRTATHSAAEVTARQIRDHFEQP